MSISNRMKHFKHLTSIWNIFVIEGSDTIEMYNT